MDYELLLVGVSSAAALTGLGSFLSSLIWKKPEKKKVMLKFGDKEIELATTASVEEIRLAMDKLVPVAQPAPKAPESSN